MLCKLSWQVRLLGLARTSLEPVLPVSGALRDSPRSQRGGRRGQDLPERDRTQCIAYALQMVLAATVYGRQAVQELVTVSPGEEEPNKEELQDNDQC